MARGGFFSFSLSLACFFLSLTQKVKTMALALSSSSTSVRGLVACKSSTSRSLVSFAPVRSARRASVKAAASPLSSSSTSSTSTFALSPRRPPMASFLRGLMGSKVRFLFFLERGWTDPKVIHTCAE